MTNWQYTEQEKQMDGFIAGQRESGRKALMVRPLGATLSRRL